MNALRLTLAVVAAAPALALAAPVPAPPEARNDRYFNSEGPPRARESAEEARVRPLIEAEKLRPRISGTWQVERFIPALMTSAGKLPPMTAATRKLYNARIAARKAGKTDDPVEACLPPGTPRSLFMDAPFIIAQTPVKVTFYHQYQHITRHVFLDGPLKTDDLDPSWQGTSAGRWEGDTLVIETGAFHGRLWLDQAGLPQSAQAMVTERFRLLDPNTLQDVITFDDKGAYTAPWTTSVRFKRLPDDTLIKDDICNEKLLDFPLTEKSPPTGTPTR